jgi:hypothetical protein
MKYIFYKGYIRVETNKGDEFLIDADDYKKVSLYTSWWIDAQGYVRTEWKTGGRKVYLKLHNLIMNHTPSKNAMVDHINMNKKDNRKVNLRLVNKKQNALNSGIQSNNTSGVRGVSRCKNGRWMAYIKVDGKRLYLGVYVEKRNAVKVRLLAEKKYFGLDFSPQKHLFSKFNIARES